MTIDIQYVQMPVSESTSIFITQKLKKLSKKYEWVTKATVFFKLENNASTNNKICEILLSVPGPQLFAKSNEDYFEKAAMNTLSDIEKQLKKRKSTLIQH